MIKIMIVAEGEKIAVRTTETGNTTLIENSMVVRELERLKLMLLSRQFKMGEIPDDGRTFS